MSITVAKESNVYNSFADSEQPEIFSEGLSLSISWRDLNEDELFTKQDFETALKKVSRKIKK